MDFVQSGKVEQATANGGLVTDDHQAKPHFLHPPHALDGVREQFDLGHRPEIILLDDNGAVTIENGEPADVDLPKNRRNSAPKNRIPAYRYR